jgi:hypothetical protein
MEQNDPIKNRRRLKSLIAANGYTANRFGENGYEIPFGGQFRDWRIRAYLHNGWLVMHAFVMRVPAAGAARAQLFERMLEVNDDMSVAKFSKYKDMLTLDLEYREEHINAESLRNLLGLMHSLCEQHYTELFRIASGENALASLEAAYQRPALSERIE